MVNKGKPMPRRRDAKLLPVEYLLELFDVNFDTGVLTWRDRPQSHFPHSDKRLAALAAARCNGRFAGKVAGSINTADGYIRVKIDKECYLAHRIIWAIKTGNWPNEQIDHANGDRSDNRFANLSAVTNSQNARNQRPRQGGTSRWPGVSWDKATKKWQVHIRIDGRKKNLGRFDCEQKAAEVYRKAAQELGCSERHLAPAS